MLVSLKGPLTVESSGSSKIKFTVVTGVKVLDLRGMLGGVRLDKIMLSAEGVLVGVPGLMVSRGFKGELVGLTAS